MQVEELIGKHFGRLVVLSVDSTRNSPMKYVWCQCTCGNVKSISASSLTRNITPTRSCGCIQKEYAKQFHSIDKLAKDYINTNKEYNTHFGVIAKTTPQINNTSGHAGVSYNKEKRLWHAYLYLHRKRIHIGYFANKEDAIKARENAEDKYFEPLIEEKEKRNEQRNKNRRPCNSERRFGQ